MCVQRKIQNKPNKLASAKVKKSKETEKVRKSDGGTKKRGREMAISEFNDQGYGPVQCNS